MSLDLSADQLERLHKRLTRWIEPLRAAGLDGLVGTLLDVAEPFSPLGAQALWIAQPALSLLAPADEIGGLAALLDDPAGVAWLRAALTAPESTEDS